MNCAIEIDPWSTTTTLKPHQVPAVAKMLPARVGALFMDMGLGKSRTAIELARIRQRKIDRIIWFCPVASKETIRYQIMTHTDCQPEAIHVFSAKTKDSTIPISALWYVVGIESMSAGARAILAVKRIITENSMVICDESSYIKGHRANRTNRITILSECARYRLILTGTPLSQGVQDLFAQMRFLSPKILGYRSWYSFQRNHLEYSERFRGLIVRAHNTEYIAAKIKPYVYQITKEEALDLPDKLYESRRCSLTMDQERAYQAAKDRFVEDVMNYANPSSTMESSIPIFRLFTTLQAIVCGYDNSCTDPEPLAHNRLELLLAVIAEIPEDEKVVIWTKYRRHCIPEITAALADTYGSEQISLFHGGLNERKRQAELTAWRKGRRFFLATQACGGHAIDLTASRYFIFYANGFKFSERMQTEDRGHRIGQDRRPIYVDLWASCGIEERISQSMIKKGNVVADFRREVNRVKQGRRKERLLKMVAEL